MTYKSSINPVLGFDPQEVEISNSEIQNFKDCRRKWYFTNYLGLAKPPKLFGPLTLGTIVHAALEKYYKTYDLNDLTDQYTKEANKLVLQFESSPESEDVEFRKKFYSETIELGRIMVEGYRDMIEEEGYDASVKIISVEEKLEHIVKGLEFDRTVKLIGKIDARIQRATDGTYGVLDHKTVAAGNWEGYYQTSNSSEQFLHYNVLEKMNRPDDDFVDGGVYNLLKKVKRSARAKPPFYGRVDVRFSSNQLRNYYDRTIATVVEMVRTREALDNGANHHEVAYPHITKDCSWKCPLYNYCVVNPFIDDSPVHGRYEEMLLDNFEQVNPLQRYVEEEITENTVILTSEATSDEAKKILS